VRPQSGDSKSYHRSEQLPSQFGQQRPPDPFFPAYSSVPTSSG